MILVDTIQINSYICSSTYNMAENILDKARGIVYSGQEKTERQYGPPAESFKRIADLATILCGKVITPTDVARVQMAVKLSRESRVHKEDNLIDLCGYAAILNDLIENDEEAIH